MYVTSSETKSSAPEIFADVAMPARRPAPSSEQTPSSAPEPADAEPEPGDETEPEAEPGTVPVIDMPMPGFVPYVIIGSSAEPSRVTVLSYVAPSSVGSVRQRATASRQASPWGANGRPST